MSVTNEANLTNSVGDVLSLRDLTTLLIKHYDLHEGKFDLLIEYQVGSGMSGPSQASLSPSVFVGLAKVGLVPSGSDLQNSVDAASVNPKKKRQTRSNNPE